MFTTAAVGPAATEPPSELLIADSLADTLRPHERPVRLLVPVTGESLTAGVQAVVEWAWKQEGVEVVAVYDNHLLFTDLERRFLDEGSDSTISAEDVAYTIGQELAVAPQESCLIAVLNDEAPDALTKTLVDLAFLSEVPVYDIAHAMIPVDPFDLTGWDTADTADPDEPEAAAEEPVEEAPAKMAVAEVSAPPLDIDTLKDMRRGWVIVEKTAAEWLGFIDDELKGRGHAPKPRQGKIYISTDGGLTKQPRGRGKAPKDSIEYNEAGEVIRRH
jgi:hypothetical protein